ncbi:carboxylate-amine ligase [Actinoplanes sp. CA-030573]|uniref:carboxylate-amine ligase n=1 Tax=Actinoplanes sp. CA-030573 TaxID=3239898 RepID=UPI003D8F9BC5
MTGLGPTVGPTVGVEEEFLLVDPHSGVNVPAAEKVFAGLGDRAHREFRQSMVEMVTGVCTGLGELGDQLLTNRRAAAAAATATGARLVAIGATPVAEPVRAPAGDPRFEQIVRHYGPIGRDAAVCGCHVHVGVPSRALAVEVCTRLRGWLPVIQAIAANSPLYLGADSGHASWRGAQLRRWPGLGPWPHLRSAGDFDRTVAALVASGVMLDESMVLWYARPSARFPTVEIRVADVCLSVADTVLVTALVRALVATAAAGDLPATVLPDVLVDAAHWNATRDGLGGTLLDVRSGVARPAWDLVGELTELIGPALRRHGDHEAAHEGLGRLGREGTGADRQRRWLSARGDVLAVLDDVAAATVAPPAGR